MGNKGFNTVELYSNKNGNNSISLWKYVVLNAKLKKKWLPIILLISYFNIAFSQIINVDAAIVIKSFDHNPAAINLNYLMDDDYYLNPGTPLTQSLDNMSIGMLRFPGGEKADNYLWSAPPYTSANPYFATQGNCNWPNNDPIFSSNQINPLSTTMDFDEFMVVCNSISAAPLIVVSGDAHYNTWCSNPPTLNDLITNAVEWVKYANITNNYNIKYWMVGNESWNKAANGDPSTASQYANDFIQFSKAMKAIDPTISVVANSKQGLWIDTLLQIAAGYVDVIAISNYPIFNWTNGYDTYRTGNPNFIAEINSVISSIGTNNIRVIVTEYNSIDWSGNWTNENDLGHALVNFQMFGDQISIPKVDDAYLWNSRWVENLSDRNHLYDAIDANGDLNATGKALAMWGNNFLDKLVFSDDNGFVNSFATLDNSGDNLNIFLINKDYTSKNVIVNVANYAPIYLPSLMISESKLTGISVMDKFPIISSSSGNITVSGSQINILLDPLSINVIKLKADAEISVGPTKDNNITIYPNPSNNIISISASPSELTQISIYNVLGQDVTMLTTIIKNNESIVKINIVDLYPGFYIIKTKTSANKIFKK